MMDRLQTQREAAARKISTIVHVWNSHSFVSVGDASFFAKFSSRVHWAGDRVTEDQKAKLERRLKDFFEYYKRPTLEKYIQLRLSGENYQRFANVSLKSQLAYYEKQNVHLPQDPMQRAKAIWVLNNPTDKKGERPAILAVNMDEITINVSELQAFDSLTLGRAVRACTLASIPPNPGIIDEDNPTRIFATRHTNIFADVTFLAKVNTSSNAGPFVLNYYWSTDRRDWLASKLFFDAQTRFRTLF